MPATSFRLLAAIGVLFSFAASCSSYNVVRIIDAHSQADQHIGIEEIIGLMDDAGASRTILAARARRTPEELIAFAARHPDRITPAVRTKGQKVYQVKEQIKAHPYRDMAEVLMWHREKTRHRVTTKSGETMSPPKVVMPPDHPRVLKLLKIARRRKWPFIAHIEFGSAGDSPTEFSA